MVHLMALRQCTAVRRELNGILDDTTTLRRIAGSGASRRGCDHFQQGRVEISEVAADRMRAVVRGSDVYRVTL